MSVEAKRQPLGNLSNEVDRNGLSQKKSTLPSKLFTEKTVTIAEDGLPEIEYMPPPHTEDGKYTHGMKVHSIALHVGVNITCRIMAYCEPGTGILVQFVHNNFTVT